jgi:hypothetical protein
MKEIKMASFRKWLFLAIYELETPGVRFIIADIHRLG